MTTKAPINTTPATPAKHGDILIDGVPIDYDRKAPAPARINLDTFDFTHYATSLIIWSNNTWAVTRDPLKPYLKSLAAAPIKAGQPYPRFIRPIKRADANVPIYSVVGQHPKLPPGTVLPVMQCPEGFHLVMWVTFLPHGGTIVTGGCSPDQPETLNDIPIFVEGTGIEYW